MSEESDSGKPLMRLEGWQPIETAPLGKDVLLWWIGTSDPALKKAPPTVALGCVSAHEPGKVFTCGDYRPLEWFTHWMPPPPSPPEN